MLSLIGYSTLSANGYNFCVSTTDLHQCSTVAMATTCTCFTGAVHVHSTKQDPASQQRALRRKPVLTCRSTQSSFRGTQLVQSPRCACLSRTKVRSGAGISITAEQSYIMIKPDGVQRALVGQIINRFERKGFTLKALKMFTPSKQLAEEHYKDLSSKPFFGKLVDYIVSGPVIAMVSHHRRRQYANSICSRPCTTAAYVHVNKYLVDPADNAGMGRRWCCEISTQTNRCH